MSIVLWCGLNYDFTSIMPFFCAYDLVAYFLGGWSGPFISTDFSNGKCRGMALHLITRYFWWTILCHLTLLPKDQVAYTNHILIHHFLSISHKNDMFGRGNKWSNGILGMEEECRKRKGKEGWDLLLGCLFVCPFACELIMFCILS